jgi:hypothetical protein
MPSKVKHSLSVADILVKRFPSDMGGRAVEFLLDICQNQNPGPVGRGFARQTQWIPFNLDCLVLWIVSFQQ